MGTSPSILGVTTPVVAGGAISGITGTDEVGAGGTTGVIGGIGWRSQVFCMVRGIGAGAGVTPCVPLSDAWLSVLVGGVSHSRRLTAVGVHVGGAVS